MPQLPTQAQADIKRFYLPSYSKLPIDDQGWVDMDVSPLTGSDMDVYDTVDGAGTVEMTRELMASRISDWNFMNGTEKAPITAAGIKTFPLEDFGYLNKQLRSTRASAGLSEEAKKD
jgi:hypothetical protein